MKFAYDSIKKYFPLTETNFGQISQLEMALFDQLIYRFYKEVQIEELNILLDEVLRLEQIWKKL
jgi:hypothetical protein